MIDEKTVENLIAGSIAIALLIFVFIIVFYIIFSIFLNKFNYLKYRKKTALAWIPICQIYLLGKLTFNKILGWVLVALILSTAKLSTTDSYGVEKEYTFFGEQTTTFIQSVYGIAIIVLLIYALILYFKLKNEKEKGFNETKEIVLSSLENRKNLQQNNNDETTKI